MGVCNFRNILPINVPNCYGGRIYIFLTKNFQSHQNSITWSLVFTFRITDVVEAIIILIQERHNHSENCIKVKVSQRTEKVEICLANERSGLAFFRTDLGHIFGSNVGNEFGVMLRGKNLTNQNLLTTLYAYTLS